MDIADLQEDVKTTSGDSPTASRRSPPLSECISSRSSVPARRRKRVFQEVLNEDSDAMDSLYAAKRRRVGSRRVEAKWARLPKEMHSVMSAANNAYLRGDWTRCKECLERVLQSARHFAAGWYLLSRVFVNLKLFDKALVALQFFVGVRYPNQTLTDGDDDSVDASDSDSDNDCDSHSAVRSAANGQMDADLEETEESQRRLSKQTPAHLIEEMAHLATLTEDYQLAVRCLSQVLYHTSHKLSKVKKVMSQRKTENRSTAKLTRKVQQLSSRELKMRELRFELYDKMGHCSKGLSDIYFVFRRKVTQSGHPLASATQYESGSAELSEYHKEFVTTLKKVVRGVKSAQRSNESTRDSIPRVWTSLVLYFRPFLVDFEKYSKWLTDATTMSSLSGITKESVSVSEAANFGRMRWLRRVMAADEDYADMFWALLLTLVTSLMEQKKHKSALKFINCFCKCLSQFPFDLYVREGVCLLWCGRYEAAEEYYRVLMNAAQSAEESSADGSSTNTALASFYLLFADACIAHNKLEMARSLMRRLQSAPRMMQHIRVWTRLADLCALDKDYATAKQWYAKCIERYSKQKEAVVGELQAMEQLPFGVDVEAVRSVRTKRRSLLRVKQLLFSVKLKMVDTLFALDEYSAAVRVFKESAADLPGAFSQTYDWFQFGSETQELQTADDSADDAVDVDLEYSEESEEALSSLGVTTVSAGTELTLGSGTSVGSQLSAASDSVLAVGHKAPAVFARQNLDIITQSKTGVFGRAIIPEKLVFLQCFKNDLRVIYPQCLRLFVEGRWKQFLTVCEIKVLQMLKLFVADAHLFTPVLEANKGFEFEERKYAWNYFNYFLQTDCVAHLLVLCVKVWIQFPIQLKEMEASGSGEEVVFGRKHLHLLNQIVAHFGATDAISVGLKLSQMAVAFRSELFAIEAHLCALESDWESAYRCLTFAIDNLPQTRAAMRHLLFVFEQMRFDSKVSKTVFRSQLRRAAAAKAEASDGLCDDGSHDVALGYKRLVHNSRKMALFYFGRVLKRLPHSADAHFCVAVCLIRYVAHSTKGEQSNMAIIKALAHMKKYVQLSGASVESLFNFARAFHSLAFLGPAVFYYRKAIVNLTRTLCLKRTGFSKEKKEMDTGAFDSGVDDDSALDLTTVQLPFGVDAADGCQRVEDLDATAHVSISAKPRMRTDARAPEFAILKHCVFNLSKIHMQNKDSASAIRVLHDYRSLFTD